MGKIKKRLSSIRVSLILCIVITVLTAQALYLLSLRTIDHSMMALMTPHPDSFVFDSGRIVTINYDHSGDLPNTKITNEPLFAFYQKLRIISPIVINGVSIIIAITLYYRIKLQKSLAMLESGIEKISVKELDFSIENPSNDELGHLCSAFENMRIELAHTFHALWQSEENQRNLYRAFAHDLRTPLTIIKGNNDLIELVAAKHNDWDKALGAVHLSNNAIERIEQYAEQLRELECIDDWQPIVAECDMEELAETIKQQVYVLGKEFGKLVEVTMQKGESAYLDRNAVMRALDNLVMNALQHAHHSISVHIWQHKQTLEITVHDDGSGFSPEAFKKATTPFWSTDKSCGHIGLGLTIAKNLVEKCDGSLVIGNSSAGGASVKTHLSV